MELLTEGNIWGLQVDFIGALINASNTEVRTFDSEAATQVYTNGVALSRMTRNWSSLDFLLFPLVTNNLNEDSLTWRMAVADISNVSVTYLAIDENQGDWVIAPHLEQWVAGVAASEGDSRQWSSRRRAAPRQMPGAGDTAVGIMAIMRHIAPRQVIPSAGYYTPDQLHELRAGFAACILFG